MKDKAKNDFEEKLNVDIFLTIPVALGGLFATHSMSGLALGASIGFGLDVWNAVGKRNHKPKNPTP